MFKFDLLPGEQPITMYRQAELALTKTVLLVFILIYTPWYYLLTYGLYFDYRFWVLGWTFAVFIYAIYKYLLWLVNVNVVTSRRLINFEYRTLFHKHVLETPWERVSNISFKTTGFFSSLFKYGDVEIQVPGLDRPLIIKNVREPARIKDALWQLHHASLAARTR